MSSRKLLGAPPATPDDEYLISLEDLLRVISRRLWVILVVTGILVGVVTGFSLTQTPIYGASIKILVGQQEDNDVPGSLGGDVQGLQQITQTMAEAVNSRPVAEAVIEQLNLEVSAEDVLENMSVEQVPNTQFIEVTYEDPNPQRTQQVANTIGKVFSSQVSEVSPSANAIAATVWEPAAVPNEPVSPDPLRNALLALVLGLVLGVGLAFLLEYRDDSWRSPEEVEQISEAPVFGVIPAFTVPKGKRGKKKRRG